MNKKMNILFGVVILIALIALFGPNQQDIRLSPGQEHAPLLKEGLGLLHYECSTTCWNEDKCKIAESFEEDNTFNCKCSECENSEGCKITSMDRTNFNWNC
jgi:hypothetical protein